MSIDNINIEKLEELIEGNYSLAVNKRKKLALLTAKAVNNEKNPSVSLEKTMNNDDNDENAFVDTEIDEYIASYNSLDSSFSKEDLLDVLPDFSNKRFSDIILRLKAESLREIHELNLLCSLDEDNLSREEYLSAIEFHKKKMSLLDECNKKGKVLLDEETPKNKLILVPTTGGNIRLIEELSHIPFEYYPDFLELVDSIVDGSFKNVKRFRSVNNSLKGISEVKGFKVRVVFSRIGVDSYALISAFVKKSDNDKGYKETLKKKVADYYNIKDKLISNLDNDEFMAENEKSVMELYDLLNTYNNDYQYKKGGLYE